VKAVLRNLHTTELDLKEFRPNGPFGISVRAIVGPIGERGEESFDFVVCSPDWFALNMPAEFVLGRHYLFAQRFDYAALEEFVRTYCESCAGESWRDVAEKVGRLGMWEFEDYRPYRADG
jgi:hypothetical protein